MLLFNKFLTKITHTKRTVSKAGPSNIPWDSINTKQSITDSKKHLIESS